MDEMARSFLDRRFVVLGGSVPVPVALLIAATLVCSILSARLVGFGHASALVPGFVFTGQIWRLATWVFIEPDPLGLIFACLGLFWFGSDLLRIWGARRFLGAYLGLAAAAGGVTCAAALVPRTVLMGHPFVGAWAPVSALIIAWACAFPDRTMALYFVVRLHGRNLVYATLGGTLIFALLGGIENYIPHFAAQLVCLAWMKGNPIRPLLARVRFELAYGRWRRRTSRLREVPRPPRDENPRYYH
jgi:membrane associated rhomboid family serine protease